MELFGILTFLVIYILLLYISDKQERKMYNVEKCEHCGGKMEYTVPEDLEFYLKVYKCENCGHTVIVKDENE